MWGWLLGWIWHPITLIAVGSAVGGNLRYYLGGLVDRQHWFAGWPSGTFTVNVLGSFILGFLAVSLLERLTPAQREAYLLLGTGFCGGFTTFSTFEWETYKLLRDGAWPLAAAYVLSSCLVGLVAVVLGAGLAHLCLGRGH